jgi:hypothetical protein
MTQSHVDDDRSLSRLVSDLSEQASRLARLEGRLAARESAAKAKRAGAGIGGFAVAAVLASVAGLTLVAFLVLLLSTVLAAWAAALIVAGALLLIAAAIALFAKAQLRKAMPPVPADAVERVREDIEVVKERSHS